MNTATTHFSKSRFQATTVIYQTLEKLSNDNQAVFISYNELAKRSGYSRTRVISAVNQLSLQHRISKQTECDIEKGYLRNLYVLHHNVQQNIY